MNIFLNILLIGYAISWLLALTNGILLLIPAVRCRKVRHCKKDDCPFRSYCKRISLSDAEKDFIQKKIDSLK